MIENFLQSLQAEAKELYFKLPFFMEKIRNEL